MAGQIGKIKEFDIFSDDSNWDEYVERLQYYFVANDITGAGKKRAVLLSCCGGKVYRLVRNLCAPDLPDTKTYDELVHLIGEHLNPKPLVIAERYRFYLRTQSETENVSQFKAALQRLTEHCQFGAFLKEALRDRFVCGLASRAIQKKLLSESDLTLERAMKIAVGMEMAEKETTKLNTATCAESVNKIEERAACFRCGKSNHGPEQCFHKNSKCHKCKQPGHLSKMCRNDKPASISKPAQKQKPVKKRKSKPKVHYVEDSDSDDAYDVFSITSRDNDNIHVNVTINKKPCKMELDTGASVSLMPIKVFERLFRGRRYKLNDSTVVLKTYTGESVPVLGELDVTVKHKSQSELLPLVIVKGDGPALLGRNWLSKLRIDWKYIKKMVSSDANKRLDSILMKTKAFNGKLGTIKGVQAKLKVKPDSTPKFYKARPVPYALRDRIADELSRLEKQGIVEKVKFSDWAAPIVPVLKPDKTVRICGDYKVTVNQVLDVPEHPLPTSEEIFSKLNGGQKFTKLDLSHAYQQVVLDKDSKQYVTINTHLGLYRYTRLPFGVAAAPAVFQETMDKVLEGLENGCIIDDIILTGRNDTEHLENLEATLKRLDEYGIKLKKDKCAFMVDEVEYFGFIVNKDGIRPSPKRLKAILDVAPPTCVKELQSWLGIINYYRKFVPNLSTVVEPLNRLLVKGAQWDWSESCNEAFMKVRDMLVSSDILVHYQPEKPLVLAVDASAVGLGAVLSHDFNGVERPFAYASRTLSSAERNYSQIEKEALAIIFGVNKFHQYLYGRQFTLLTDHKPLTTILGPKRGIPVLTASRLQRWAIQLSAYQFDIKYKTSADNANADFLSRLPLEETEDVVDSVFYNESATINKVQIQSLPITASRIASASRKDTTLSRVMYFILNGWPNTQQECSHELLPYWRVRNELTVEEGCILRGIRVIIPCEFQSDILTELHENHPGIVRMKSLARLYVWWPLLDSDIENKVSTCQSCQHQRPQLAKAPTNPWVWPHKPWQRIHIDFAGPFMDAMFLIVVDARSKWIEVFKMNTTTTVKTVNILRYLFASYGIPEEVVSDNGPQFISHEFEVFLKRNGVKHIRSAPYHPSSNGEAERAVRTFKEAMKTMKKDGRTMSQRIASFLFSYRSTPHCTTKCTPAELFLGRRLRTRFDVMRPNLAKKVNQSINPTLSSQKTRDYSVGDVVLARDYINKQNKWKRGVILRKLGPVTYKVQVGELVWKRHINQLCSTSADLSPVIPEPVYDEPLDIPITPCEVRPHVSNSRRTEQLQSPEPVNEQPNDSIPVSEHSADVTTETPRRTGRMRRKPSRLIEEM